MRKLLIANRGEIACRIIKTARRMGIKTVAVFSRADQNALHVKMADEAVFIGPAEAAKSYLDMTQIIAACLKSNADSLHPGYGFLSERADFAKACEDAGIVFVGPSPEAIAIMGDKAKAKIKMVEAGVPCAPGYPGENQDVSFLAGQAEKLGMPLLVKAIAGGGGRGMRLVTDPAEITDAISSARREAESAFGNGDLMLERLIENGRHIEVQVFGDSHGNLVHLGERDCTAQRRRQKVIEEAPSPIVSDEMRERLGKDAVAAAKAVDYRGAGTVEFMVDQELNHYFLEMNTRLQVEHPVTEMVTGIDLVEWQLRIAAGEPLPLQQEHINITGHAIEARLYAEDPYEGFSPQTGNIIHWHPETSRPGSRIDNGIEEGGQVTPFYDPMVAKLIANGKTRDEAIRQLLGLLEETPLLGITNNGSFLHDLIDTDHFRDAKMNTGMIDGWMVDNTGIFIRPMPDAEVWALAAAIFSAPSSPGFGIRPESVSSRSLTLACGGETKTLDVHAPTGTCAITMDEQTIVIERLELEGHSVSADINGLKSRFHMARSGGQLHLATGAQSHIFAEYVPFQRDDAESDPTRIVSPVSGSVSALEITVGDTVEPGTRLGAIEAMKMETPLLARAPGTVSAIHCKVGTSVNAGMVLIELETHQPDEGSN